MQTNRSLTIALLRARESLMVEFRPLLAKHGFTEQQWRVLRLLIEAEAVDATTLSIRSCILAPSLTRIIKNLEGRGLLQRGTSKTDARKLVLTPTKLALEVSDKITPETAKIFNDIEKRYGLQRTDVLLDMLQQLCKANSSKRK